MRRFIPILFLVPIHAGAQGNGYTYARTITIHGDKYAGASNLTDFPMLFNEKFTYLRTVGNGGNVQSSSGYDIVYSSTSDCGTLLNWDHKTYDATNGIEADWIKLTISNSASTTIYLCYGNSGISTFQGGTASTVWSNGYIGVWHLGDGTTLNVNDSLGSTGTNHGATAVSFPLLHGGAHFVGASSQWIDTGNTVSGVTDFTLEAWAYNVGGSGNQFFFGNQNSTNNDGEYALADPSVGYGVLMANATNFWGKYMDNGPSANPTYIVGIHTTGSSNMGLYINSALYGGSGGTTWSNGGSVTDPADSSSNFAIGKRGPASSSPGYYTGDVAEIRMSNVARSVDWITACYVNQLSPNSFYTVSGISTATRSSSGYHFVRSVTIAHGQVPTQNETDFPMLFAGTYSYLADTGHSGNVQSTSGYDIIFTSDSACHSRLSHEIDSYDNTTGKVSLWVKIPTLSTSVDTVIYLCYGNAGISTSQENIADTWSNGYWGVWHFKGSLDLTNSASAYGMNWAASNNGVTSAAAAIGNGAAFASASSQWIDLGDAFNIGLPFTLQMWVKNATSANFANANNFGFRFFNWEDGSKMSRRINDPGTLSYTVDGDTSVPVVNIWNLFQWSVTDARHQTTVQNGSDFTTSNVGALPIPYAKPDLVLGQIFTGGWGYYNGLMDEVRLSNTARSTPWMITEFNNQCWAEAIHISTNICDGTFPPFYTVSGATTPPSTIRHRSIIY